MSNVKIFSACASVSLMLLGQVALAGGPYGIDQPRQANSDLIITELPASSGGAMVHTRVFPQLKFAQMVLMVEAPDDSNRLFVVTKNGFIYTFPNVADPSPGDVSTFLNVSSITCSNASTEQGLLGLAFDPDYATNGEFYIYYSHKTTDANCSNFVAADTVVARFTNDVPSDNSVSLATREEIIRFDQPFTNHNGGMIAFGPDNMLYIAVGDGGSGGDPFNHGQDTTTLFGALLRIDVRGTPDLDLDYAIPPDNPFVTDPPVEGSREEIWAYGLRNPWRFSFDMLNGTLYLADVGQNQYEEVDIIQKGRNYGWKIREGMHCYNAPTCDTAGLTEPILEYSHSGGRSSITGGYVYYGSEVPSLYGRYIFADYGSKEVFSLYYPGGVSLEVLAQNSSITPAGLGQDSSGEVYILDFDFSTTSNNGGIYVLRPQGAPPTSSFPNRLSDLPALHDAASGENVTGVIPYRPASSLWSDNTRKERYIALPNLDQLEYASIDSFGYDENALLIKNFLLPLDERDPDNSLQRIETRLLYRKGGNWHGYSYEWDEAETDGTLLTTGKDRQFTIINEDGLPEEHVWHYPSRTECFSCHTGAAGTTLGVTSAMLNCEFLYPASGVTDNQLRTMDWISLFDTALPNTPANLDAVVDYTDETASIGDRARGYLAANCAQCHRPGGGSPVLVDFRWETPDDEMNAIGSFPFAGNLGVPDARIIVPGDPDSSILYLRMNRRGLNQMPPLGSHRIDEYGVEIMRQWIIALGATSADSWTLY